MSPKVRFITPEQTCKQELALMTERKIRQLHEMLGGELIGIVSVGDLVNAGVDDHK
jgi:CBS domain-containing protein